MSNTQKLRRIGIVFNPISGKGLAQRRATELAQEIKATGLELAFILEATTADSLSAEIANSQSDLLVVCGGDGTLQHALPALVARGIAVYLLPCGNESLFARDFNMCSEPQKVLAAIHAERIERHFVARVGERYFFTMLSVGFDSLVIKALALSRRGTVSHLKYLRPILLAACSHRAPRVNLTLDGKEVLHAVEGYLIVANTAQYALGIPFVPEATSSVPILHIRFFPYRSVFNFILLAIRLRLGANAPKDALSFSGNNVEISCVTATGLPDEYPVQVEGEYLGSTPQHIDIGQTAINILRGV